MPVAVAETQDRPQQRRPQRQQLVPFPSDAPKEPNRVELKDAIEKLRADVNRAKERIDDIKAKLTSRTQDPEKERLLEEKRALIGQRKELDDRIMEKVKQRNAVQDRLRAVRSSTREVEKEVKELNKELRDYKSVEEVDKRIKELEFRLETSGSGSLKSEKRVMQEIKQLQQQRAKVGKLDQKLASIQAKTKDFEGVGGDQRELQREIDALRDESSELRDRIDGKSAEIASKNDQGQMQVMREEKDTLHKKISDTYAKMDGLRSKFEEDKKVYDEFRAEHKKKEDAAWEKRRAEQQAERARRDEERRVKDLEIAAVKRLNPHEEEIAVCKTLIEYCNGKVKSVEAEEKRSTERKHFDAAAVAGAKGFAVMGKKDKKGGDDWFLEKKPKAVKPPSARDAKKPAAAAVEKEAPAVKSRPINHQFPKFEAFSKVGVKIPMRTDDVPEAIKQLKEKLAHYQTFIKTEKEAMEEERIAQEKAAAEKLEKEAAEAAEAAQEGEAEKEE
eukprot:Hpha_TRINITY_DN15547_c2_g3::TRINITY_DN15547_c2_g3_i1::g.108529::m.108529